MQFVRCRARFRIFEEPAFVDHCVAPTERKQLVFQNRRIGAKFRFGDGQPVGVPAIPTHGRSGGNYRLPTYSGKRQECQNERELFEERKHGEL